MTKEDFDAGRLGEALEDAARHYDGLARNEDYRIQQKGPTHKGYDQWGTVDEKWAREDAARYREMACKLRAVVEALTAARAARPEAGWREPDHIYDPDDWDATYNWDDRSIAAENCVTGYVARGGDPFQPKKFCTLNAGAPVWAREIVLTRDDCGDPDETEVRWFKSEEEALACEPCPTPPTGDKPDA